MKDEIKEILEDKKVIIDQHWNYIIIGNEKYYDLPKRLLDYITNLQEKNERLKMDIRYWEDKWQYTKFSDKDYKSRIDEAIKFVNENAISDVQWWINKDTKITCYFAKDTDPRDLLEILQGNNN